MALGRWVIVDDAEPNISYGGSWFLDGSGSQDNIGNFGPPYLGTLHGIKADGSVSFQFNAVEVWGTNNVANFDTDPDPTLQCFVDDVSIGQEAPFQFSENNWRLCGKVGFPDGLHNLRAEVGVLSPSNTFWLDQIRYIPSLYSLLHNKIILYENMDPDIQFDTQWTSLGNVVNMTQVGGSVAMVTFIGTSISWYAFIPTELPHNASQGSWSIDIGEDNVFPLKGLPADSQTTVYNQEYFTTPEFPAGLHTLIVTFHGSSQTTPLCLDYIYVKNGIFTALSSNSTSDIGTTATSTLGTTATSILGTMATSTLGTTATSTLSFRPVNGGTPRATPVGAIVGGIIRGLALLFCIASAYLFYKCRRRNSSLPARRLKYTTPTQFPLRQDRTHGTTPEAPNHMTQTGPQASTTNSSPSPFTHRGPRKLRQEAEIGGHDASHTSNPTYPRATEGSSFSPRNPSTSRADDLRNHPLVNGMPQTPPLSQPRFEDVPPHYTEE